MYCLGATEDPKKALGNRWGSYYPWATWFAQGAFTLEHGKDYDCSPLGMTANVRSQAKKRGLRVKIETDSWQMGKMTVTVVRPPKPGKGARDRHADAGRR